jgi:hypothetical protein
MPPATERVYVPFSNAGALYECARCAYERAAATPGELVRYRLDPLVAIVFAAISLEGFINELAEFATTEDITPEPSSVQDFAPCWRDIECRHGNTQEKFQAASRAFRHEPYDRGSRLFQDFVTLMAIRDDLVHRKPIGESHYTPTGALDVREPRYLKRLRSRKPPLVRPFEPEGPIPLIKSLNTSELARWACATTCAMVQSVREMLPESRLKRHFETRYTQDFQPPVVGA